MDRPKRCNSCNIELTNIFGSTSFKCPACGENEIIRCKHCRDLGSKYTCESCKFSGPN